MQCAACSHVCKGPVVPHTFPECPYRMALYCPVCMVNGHSELTCPDKEAWAIRKGKPLRGVKNLVLRVPDSEEGIREFLKSRGLKPSARKLENKKLLQSYAIGLKPPRVLVYHSHSVD